MKRLLKPLIYGVIVWAIAWALVLITNSGFGPCNPTGPFAWLLMLLLIPGMLIEESLGEDHDLIATVFASVVFIVISGVLLDVTFRVIGKIRARFSAIDSSTRRKS